MRPTRTTTTINLADARHDEHAAETELQHALRLLERATVRARRARAAVREARALHEQAITWETLDAGAAA